ncbi:MAG: FMN-binding protein [Lachnospiraceae bacterium]|nr:FMN-binding protein [Lachnospiraceae bacterium]
MTEGKKKNSLFQDMIKPVLVLLIIAAVVAALLAFVHNITEPIIAENSRIAAEKARMEVLPDADAFTEIPYDEEQFNITSAYKADNGCGYVFTSANKGYGGDVVVTVGLDGNGNIVGIKADVSTETSGVGSKAGEEKYLSLYMGISGSDDNIDTISGATYSSTAVKTGVASVLEAFEALK